MCRLLLHLNTVTTCLFSYCLFIFQSDYGPVRESCNIWRNFWDVSDSWDSIAGIIKYYGQNNSLFINYTGPGGFFDPDMVGTLIFMFF